MNTFKKAVALTLTAACMLPCIACNRGTDLISIDKRNTQTTKAQAALHQSQAPTATAKEQKSLLEILPLQNETGEKLNKKVFTGKNVFVIFWTTWCHYCKAELEDLKVISERYKEQENLTFLAVNVLDEKEEAGNAKKYFSEHGINIPLAFIKQSAASSLGISGYPFNFILNSAGNLHSLKYRDKRSIKYFFAADKEQIDGFIKQILEA